MKVKKVMSRYGNGANFLNMLNPSAQLTAGKNPESAILSEDAPTLAIMRKVYGEEFPATWLMPQVLDLVVFSNSKNTLDDKQAEFLAEVIANEYYFLKASELLLFFYNFKTGKYGRFYGVVDPMRIMEALGEFKDERDRVIEQHRKETEDAKAAMEPKLPSIKPEEWCRQCGIPEMHSVIEVYAFVGRVNNTIDAVLWFINNLWRALP